MGTKKQICCKSVKEKGEKGLLRHKYSLCDDDDELTYSEN